MRDGRPQDPRFVLCALLLAALLGASWVARWAHSLSEGPLATASPAEASFGAAVHSDAAGEQCAHDPAACTLCQTFAAAGPQLASSLQLLSDAAQPAQRPRERAAPTSPAPLGFSSRAPPAA